MKKFLVVIIMLLCLCGCTNAKQVLDQEEHTPTAQQQNLAEEGIGSSSEEQEESFFSQPVSTASMDAEQKATQKADSDNSVPTNKSDTEDTVYSSKADAKSSPEQSVIKTSVPISTPSPIPTSIPKPKASQSPTPTPIPTPSPTPAPQVDITYWVSYAKSCASCLGLTLNSSAVDCWDNPITATSKSTCLERDISSRLSRYAADEDITDVWIWSESIGNGSYNIYIGYA